METRGRVQTVQNVEDTVADLFGREHAVLTGRATTALYVLFDVLDIDGEIIYPAYTCPSPIYAAKYAGATPVFCDVRQDYTIDPDELEARISADTDAVVAIDLFGHPAAYDRIEETCREHDALLVEDACQAVGTTYQGQKTGTFGDVAVLSFGDKKPIDAGGGGALLTDDAGVAEELRDAAETIPVRDSDRQSALAEYYRDLYYLVDDLRSMTPEAERIFAELPDVFRELYLIGLEPETANTLQTALEQYESTVETRREHAQLYRDELTHSAVTHPEPEGEPVPYRYSIGLPNQSVRDAVVSELRSHDFHVSTLYDTIHQRFGSDGAFPTAVDLTERTLNLWVSAAVDDAYITDCVSRLEAALTEATNE